MATKTQASMKEQLAAKQADRKAVEMEAKTRVAAAWTITKTMLPSASDAIQKAAAENLLLNKTSVLKAMLRKAGHQRPLYQAGGILQGSPS